MQTLPKFLATLVLGMVVVSAPASAVTFLQERFNGTTFPPAGWTVVDNAGSGVVWTTIAGSGASSNYTGGGGDAASVNGDLDFLVFDTALVTPSIALSGIPAFKVLHFVANYQDRGPLDALAVELSTNGGTSWAPVTSPWIGNHGAFEAQPGECVSVDVSAVIGAAPSVQFRFVYDNSESPAPGWYAQVDDVVLDDQASFPCPIFADGFEGGNRSAWSSSVPSLRALKQRGEHRRGSLERGGRRRIVAESSGSEPRPGRRNRGAKLRDAVSVPPPSEPSAPPPDSAPPRR